MNIVSAFGEDYADARARFLSACRDRGVAVDTRVHPLEGPDGEGLATDIVRFGAPNPRKLLVVSSGVHGPEMMAGSGAQTGFVKHSLFEDLPADTGVLIIHAINPWGAAHLRRNTEDNVDLCRNFVDFSQRPENAAYAQLHDALLPPAFENMGEPQAAQLIGRLRSEHGPRDFMNGLMGGQFDKADGFGFGGFAPTWSRTVWLGAVEEHAAKAEQIQIIDIHSGLGPWGYGMAVCLHRGEALARARRQYGGWIFAPRDLPPEDPQGLFDVHGHCSDGFEHAFGADRVTAIVVEFGTYPAEAVFPALIRDHWIAMSADVPENVRRENRERMREIHYPGDPEWRRAVWDRSHQVVRQAMAGLAA